VQAVWLLYDTKNKISKSRMSTTQMVEDIKAKEFSNFLSKQEVLDILNFAKNTNLWGDAGDGFWDGRVINASAVSKKNSDLGNSLGKIKQRILDTVKNEYGIQQEIYLDLLQITRWFPGMEQPPHSDNMENTMHSQFHKHREYGTVIYLNNDFTGGATFYPQHNFYINPEPGKLAIHPASTDHMHGVTKIEGSIRYTLTSFLTFDKTKKMQEL